MAGDHRHVSMYYPISVRREEKIIETAELAKRIKEVEEHVRHSSYEVLFSTQLLTNNEVPFTFYVHIAPMIPGRDEHYESTVGMFMDQVGLPTRVRKSSDTDLVDRLLRDKGAMLVKPPRWSLDNLPDGYMHVENVDRTLTPV